MGIDNNKFISPAIRGDVSGVAIHCAIAIDHIADCLVAIDSGRPIDPVSLQKIRSAAQSIQKIFEELTGWTKE